LLSAYSPTLAYIREKSHNVILTDDVELTAFVKTYFSNLIVFLLNLTRRISPPEDSIFIIISCLSVNSAYPWDVSSSYRKTAVKRYRSSTPVIAAAVCPCAFDKALTLRRHHTVRWTHNFEPILNEPNVDCDIFFICSISSRDSFSKIDFSLSKDFEFHVDIHLGNGSGGSR
jgi:hypothetical protein